VRKIRKDPAHLDIYRNFSPEGHIKAPCSRCTGTAEFGQRALSPCTSRLPPEPAGDAFQLKVVTIDTKTYTCFELRIPHIIDTAEELETAACCRVPGRLPCGGDGSVALGVRVLEEVHFGVIVLRPAKVST
jgi:hypothetical protein